MITLHNLSFGKWVSICANLSRAKAVQPTYTGMSPPTVNMNNSTVPFSSYEFFAESQKFQSLSLIDVMLFLRSLTGYFWVKTYYIKALFSLRYRSTNEALKYVNLALDYYMSKQKEDSIEYLTAFIVKEGLNK